MVIESGTLMYPGSNETFITSKSESQMSFSVSISLKSPPYIYRLQFKN